MLWLYPCKINKYNTALKNTSHITFASIDQWLLTKLQGRHWSRRRGGLVSLATWRPWPAGAPLPARSVAQEGLQPRGWWNCRSQGLWSLCTWAPQDDAGCRGPEQLQRTMLCKALLEWNWDQGSSRFPWGMFHLEFWKEHPTWSIASHQKQLTRNWRYSACWCLHPRL